MNILAFDTATECCSVALLLGENRYHCHRMEPTGHSRWLLPMVDQLLAQAGIGLHDLNLIAVDIGPGSFTGIRIGVGIAQGLAYALQLKVQPVSSLQALAFAADSAATIAAIDARMGQLYWGLFQSDPEAMLPLSAELRVTSPQDPALIACIQGRGLGRQRPLLVGSGWSAYGDELANTIETDQLVAGQGYPLAATIAEIAARSPAPTAVAANDLKPLYIRNQVVRLPAIPLPAD